LSLLLISSIIHNQVQLPCTMDLTIYCSRLGLLIGRMTSLMRVTS